MVYHIHFWSNQLSPLHYASSNCFLNLLKGSMVMRKAALGFLGVLLARFCSATVLRFPLSSIAVSCNLSAHDKA